MFYITFGESPGGVYEGQVIDVCRFLNKELKADITLVSFISIRNYFDNRKRIKKGISKSIVLPMTPKINTWRWNVVTLLFWCLIKRPKAVICRNPLATNLALRVKQMGGLSSVCYDGRGAMAAEFEEYLSPDRKRFLSNRVEELEKKAVIKSDFRIAVSKKLVEYWQNRYSYSSTNHVVVPCTVNQYFLTHEYSKENRKEVRAQLGFLANDIVYVYAGSTAGWQSFSLIYDFLDKQLRRGINYKVLFLSSEDKNNKILKKQFPEQVIIKRVLPAEVPKYLRMCDYGLLLREPSITNRVAAPTKFAEYLISGLPVIVSENVGDYSDFVTKHACGIVLKKNNNLDNLFLRHHEFDEKKLRELAQRNFTKYSTPVFSSYKRLIRKIL